MKIRFLADVMLMVVSQKKKIGPLGWLTRIYFSRLKAKIRPCQVVM